MVGEMRCDVVKVRCPQYHQVLWISWGVVEVQCGG